MRLINTRLGGLHHGYSSARLLERSEFDFMRNTTCYPAVGPDVTRAGGTFVDAMMDQAHTCEKLVTAPHGRRIRHGRAFLGSAGNAYGVITAY